MYLLRPSSNLFPLNLRTFQIWCWKSYPILEGILGGDLSTFDAIDGRIFSARFESFFVRNLEVIWHPSNASFLALKGNWLEACCSHEIAMVLMGLIFQKCDIFTCFIIVSLFYPLTKSYSTLKFSLLYYVVVAHAHSLSRSQMHLAVEACFFCFFALLKYEVCTRWVGHDLGVKKENLLRLVG